MHRIHPISNFGRDESGAILVFFALSLAVLLGMIALSFDTGRVAATQSELQSFADSVSLAAAAELDGANDSITRATAAAAAMIEDEHTFGSSNNNLAGSTDYKLTFLNDLPADDDDSVTSYITTTASEAEFAMVEVPNPDNVDDKITISTAFADLVSTFTGNTPIEFSVSARSIAGLGEFACDVTPLMFCLPNNILSHAQGADAFVGDAVELKSGGQGAGWAAGNFGFLDPTGYTINDLGACEGEKGKDEIGCLIAAAGNIGACFDQGGVTTMTGQKEGIGAAIFNTRFDMFNKSINKWDNEAKYAPGPHTIAGLVRDDTPGANQGCVPNNATASTDTMAFPTDTCFSTEAGCPNGRFGDGTWNVAQYIATNYTQHELKAGYVGPPILEGAATTRYNYYLAEVAAADAREGGVLDGLYGPILPHLSNDNGYPYCHKDEVVSIDDTDPVKRRNFVVAGIDCAKVNPKISGKTTDVPVAQFVEIFLLNPVSEEAITYVEDGVTKNGNSFSMWVEIVGLASGFAPNQKFRDVPQLHNN